MARISEQVLAGLARPAFAQGMFDLGAAIGQAPGMFIRQQKQEEQLSKLKTLSPLERAQYALQTAKTSQEINAAQQNINRILESQRVAAERAAAEEREKMKIEVFKGMGNEYLDLYTIGVSEEEIVKRHREVGQQETKQSYGKVLGLPEDVVNALTMEQVIDRVEAQKTEEGKDNFVKFMKTTKGSITEENYEEAVELAVSANGVQGIQQINNMYKETLARQAKAKNERLVDANISLKTEMQGTSFFGSPSLTRVKVALDENGNLTPESTAYLNKVATSAFIPAANINWPPTVTKPSSGTTSTPEGEDPNDPFVGSLGI
jgi:hypothetical protein